MRNARLHRVSPFVVALPLALSVFPSATRAQVTVPPRTPVVTAPKTLPPSKAVPAPAAPAVAPASMTQALALGTGERTSFGFVVGSPGPIVVNAQWTGVPLIVSLVKPGGASLDQQGAGSATLKYTATADDVKQGTLWSVSVRPAQQVAAPGASGAVIEKPIRLVVATAATGTVGIQYPAGNPSLAQGELNAKANQALAAKPAPQQATATLASAVAAKQTALQAAQQTKQVALLNTLKSQVSAQAFQNVSARSAVEQKTSVPISLAKPATKTTGTSQQAQVTSAGTTAPATVAATPTVGSLSATSGQPGDPILISGSAFSDQPGEVHFIVASGKDLVAPVSAWNDTQIFATVPDVSGVQAFSGQMYVKRGTTSSKLVPFQFNPALEIRTLNITNDSRADDATLDVAFGMVFHTLNLDFFFGHRGDDQFFMSTSLKNGWTVKSAYLDDSHGGAIYRRGSSDAYVSELRSGTNSPYVKVHWWTDAGSYVAYYLHVDIIGPKGVPHF
jgi:hypothetical protein